MLHTPTKSMGMMSPTRATSHTKERCVENPNTASQVGMGKQAWWWDGMQERGCQKREGAHGAFALFAGRWLRFFCLPHGAFALFVGSCLRFFCLPRKPLAGCPRFAVHTRSLCSGAPPNDKLGDGRASTDGLLMGTALSVWHAGVAGPGTRRGEGLLPTAWEGRAASVPGLCAILLRRAITPR